MRRAQLVRNTTDITRIRQPLNIRVAHKPITTLRQLLTVISVNNNTGVSSIESVLYGIKWAHSLAGIVECSTSHPLVKSSLEDARRKFARPVQPKEPLSVDTVCKIADHYISSSSLGVIRFLFILLVGFDGFYRMGEIRT